MGIHKTAAGSWMIPYGCTGTAIGSFANSFDSLLEQAALSLSIIGLRGWAAGGGQRRICRASNSAHTRLEVRPRKNKWGCPSRASA